uniref:Putative secreted protein n=1 Tax=Anopheles darlingi TaxID=43151 RepID=A0A2M4DPS3_ANODA
MSEVVTGLPVAMFVLLIGDLEATGTILAELSPSLVGPRCAGLPGPIFSTVISGIDSTGWPAGLPGCV